MRGFLEFIMKGRKQALLMALLFVFIPFFGWVTSAIIALVTLRIGILEGLNLVFWTALPAVAMAWTGEPSGLLFNVLAGTLLTWLLAAVLRYTVSWRTVLLMAAAIGVMAVSVAHITAPDLQAWWLTKLEAALTQASKAGMLEVTVPEAAAALKPVTAYITGLLAATFLLVALTNVVIGRWWQAILYNPGGLKNELYQLRLSKVNILAIAALTMLLLVNHALILDSLPVLILPLTLVGLSVVHVSLANMRHSILWLSVFYVFFVLMFRQVAICLALVAVLDSFIDVRKRLS